MGCKKRNMDATIPLHYPILCEDRLKGFSVMAACLNTERCITMAIYAIPIPPPLGASVSTALFIATWLGGTIDSPAPPVFSTVDSFEASCLAAPFASSVLYALAMIAWLLCLLHPWMKLVKIRACRCQSPQCLQSKFGLMIR
ncbi:hypothetical protein GGR57DRAFT_138867 [Xylariaceae sp. FL1272]|nr:hypothetical protein GGR57DRAFT_138867 [Xylariaceae sp. FL1272]